MVLHVHNYITKFLSFPHIQFTHFAAQKYYDVSISRLSMHPLVHTFHCLSVLHAVQFLKCLSEPHYVKSAHCL
jgi:hypothetical protein